MAAVLPDKIQDQITFCEQHVGIWTAAPATAVGLTSAQVSALAAVTQAAREAYDNAQLARLSSKGATSTLNSAMKNLRSEISELVKFIKAYADAQASPGAVYGLAQINEPSPPQPIPAPGKPTDFEVTLQAGGALTLSWSGEYSAASSGSFYNVYRQLPGQEGFTLMGGASGSTSETRRMSFTDATVPSSAAGAGVLYIVQGQRGTTLGLASDILGVKFGLNGGTGLVFKSFENTDFQAPGSTPLRVAA